MSELWNTFHLKLFWLTSETHFKRSCYEWTVKHISNEAVMSELRNTFQIKLLWVNCKSTFQMKLLWVNCETHFEWSCYEWAVKHISNEAVMSEVWNTFPMKLLWVNCATHLERSCYEWTEKHISNKALLSELEKQILNEVVMSELWNTFQTKLLWVNWETHFKWGYYDWTVKNISSELLWVNCERHFKWRSYDWTVKHI